MQLWIYSDFCFDNEPVYGNDRIAGVPIGAYVDYANTEVRSYVLFGIETSYEFERGVTVFLDARNLADMRYVSNFSTVTDARTANTSVFYPGR